jgi:TRAP transporter 4TM/12TM fusion protein
MTDRSDSTAEDGDGGVDTSEEEVLDEDIRRELEGDAAALEQQSMAESQQGVRSDMRALWRVAVFVVGLILSGFHLYTAVYGVRSSLVQGSFHLALGLCLIFLLYPGRTEFTRRHLVQGWALTAASVGLLVFMGMTERAGWYVVWPALGVVALIQAARHVPLRIQGLPIADLVLSLAGLGAGLYVWYFSQDIIRAGVMHSEVDRAVATVGILLVFLATQRVIGTPLVVVAGAALAYAYFGQGMPGFLAHGGYSVDRIISSSFLGTEAIFSTPIRVSSTFIFIFLIFAALLQRTGMERFFTQAAFGLTGWMTGGTAKVGVLTSAFSGTITGSSVANTVSNGAFTIPMMKKSGYKGEFAGAVEASSSTGGQLAPPVMGAAAFIMIEFTGLPYIQIISAAAIPAALFFAAQFIVIHYESKRVGIMGLPKSQLPNVGQLMLRKGYLLIPIAVIFYILAIGMSAIRAAWYAVATTVIVNAVVQVIAAIFRRWGRMEDRLTIRGLLEGLVDAARIALPIIAACAAAGLIAGVLTLTGLGLQLSRELVSLAGENLLITLFFGMVACLVLGIGLPTTANYVVTATMVSPAILFFFDQPYTAAAILSAHLFVYYYGVMADITPPVCLAAYAASGIAGSNPLRTGVQSVRIAIGGFLVPYMFVFAPQLLLHEWDWFLGPKAIVTAMVGIFAVGTAVVGFIDRGINIGVRLLLGVAGLMLLYGELTTDLIGLGVFGTIFVWQWWTGPRARRRSAIGVPA